MLAGVDAARGRRCSMLHTTTTTTTTTTTKSKKPKQKQNKAKQNKTNQTKKTKAKQNKTKQNKTNIPDGNKVYLHVVWQVVDAVRSPLLCTEGGPLLPCIFLNYFFETTSPVGCVSAS